MKFFLTFSFVLTFVFAVHPQVSVPAADATITDFDVNGLKVIFKRRTSSPTVSVGVFFRGGVRNETVDTLHLESFTRLVARDTTAPPRPVG